MGGMGCDIWGGRGFEGENKTCEARGVHVAFDDSLSWTE